MKTYWVLGKKRPSAQEGKKDKQNPFQLKQKDKASHKPFHRGSLPAPSLDPLDGRLMPLQTTHKQNRRYSTASPNYYPAFGSRKGSTPAPDEWPELDRAIHVASNPSSALIPSRSTPFSTASTVATVRTDMREQSISEEQLQASLPEELKALVAEKGNDLSLDEYAKMAEENAKLAEESLKLAEENVQKSRKLANWLAILASDAKERERGTTDGTEETGNCVIL